MAGTGPAMTTHPVMPGLEPGIHALAPRRHGKTWMAGTGPARTGNVFGPTGCLLARPLTPAPLRFPCCTAQACREALSLHDGEK